MKIALIPKFSFFLVFLLLGYQLHAQNSFIKMQRSSARVNGFFEKKGVQLENEFKAKGLVWPAKYVYIRSFKFDAQLEVWVKNDEKEKFKLFKTYRVCMTSGTMGPKRIQGDFQVPEGFYYINDFNPNSLYHLALGLNYPNSSDRILSDQQRPGDGIFIHGSCVSVGCIPVTDDEIEEIYVLASYAKEAGQDFIPVHVFPIKYSNKKSAEYLTNLYKDNPEMVKFSKDLEKAYAEFEATRQLPVILVDSKGNYLVGN